MSFRCDVCRDTLADGQKPVMVVRRLRKVGYGYFNRRGGLLKRSDGFEIEQEQKICSSCNRRFSNHKPEFSPYPKTVNVVTEDRINRLYERSKGFEGFDKLKGRKSYGPSEKRN